MRVWVTPGIAYSIGSSMVMMLVRPDLIVLMAEKVAHVLHGRSRQPELFERRRRFAVIEEPKRNLFAEERLQRRDAEVHVRPLGLDAKPTFLREALFVR